MSGPSENVVYCAQQINIPPTFPHALKLYAKAAIRTQPSDLLRWTAAYFRALANDERPPAKERLEYPPFVHPTGITPGYLKTLLSRFGRANKVRLRALFEDWRGLDLPETSLYRILMVTGLPEVGEHCDFYRFLAVACGFFGNTLLETMIYVCELLTHEPEGGSAMIPLRIFLDLYGYLADLDCSGEHPLRDYLLLVVGQNGDPLPAPSPPRDATSVSELTSGPIDPAVAAVCSCEFAEEKLALDQVCVISDESVSGQEDVPCEERPSESLQILKDLGQDDPRLADKPASPRQSAAGDKTEIEMESIDRHVAAAGGNGEPSAGADVEDLADRDDARDEGLSGRGVDAADASGTAADDASESNWLEEDVAGEAVDYETPSELESSARSCECRLDEPPPADPLRDFLQRMRAEAEAGRLETIFRVAGIGPPVSSERVTAVGLWLADCARRQQGLVGPRNIRHYLCPSLHDVADCGCL